MATNKQTTESTQEKTLVQTGGRPRILSGVVVSNKMKDTIVVAVQRYVKHPKYKKYIKRVKRYKAHDVGNTQEVGAKVSIVECPPISKEKRFRILQSDERQ